MTFSEKLLIRHVFKAASDGENNTLPGTKDRLNRLSRVFTVR
jgi:hypothetical protein